MQIIINSVYISSDDVNGWTQVRLLVRSFPCRSRALQAFVYAQTGGYVRFFDDGDDEKRVRVCTKNEQCLIYAFSIFEWRWKNFSSGPINSVFQC